MVMCGLLTLVIISVFVSSCSQAMRL